MSVKYKPKKIKRKRKHGFLSRQKSPSGRSVIRRRRQRNRKKLSV